MASNTNGLKRKLPLPVAPVILPEVVPSEKINVLSQRVTPFV